MKRPERIQRSQRKAADADRSAAFTLLQPGSGLSVMMSAGVRRVKRTEVRAPIPKGLHPSAQGCPVGGTALGNVTRCFSQPQRGCITSAGGINPDGDVVHFYGSPRVARAAQPWAKRHSPVGAELPEAAHE